MQADALEIDSLSKSVLPPRARSPERKLLPPRQRAHPYGGFALASEQRVAVALARCLLLRKLPVPVCESTQSTDGGEGPSFG